MGLVKYIDKDLTFLVIVIHCLGFTSVSANFCDWFVCHPTEQYCCGDNECCNYFSYYNNWYLWVGAITAGVILVVLYYVFCYPSCDGRTNLESDKTPIINR